MPKLHPLPLTERQRHRVLRSLLLLLVSATLLLIAGLVQTGALALLFFVLTAVEFLVAALLVWVYRHAPIR
jgi:hypothetical protein